MITKKFLSILSDQLLFRLKRKQKHKFLNIIKSDTKKDR